MLLETIGDLLPSAVGVAISPVPIVAVVLMLATQRGRALGIAFSIGWIAGLTIACTIVAVTSGAAGSDDGQPSTAVGWLDIGLGALFLYLAVQQWRHRPRGDEQAPTPAWMANLDHLATGRALLLGGALAALNVKNLALVVAAATTIGDAGLSAGGRLAAGAVFVLLGSVSVAGPTIASLAAPAKAERHLGALRELMSAHIAVIMIVLFLLLGSKLLGAGLAVVAR